MPRHLAIGDIHGCFNALQTLCDFVGLRDDDVIITLGDYVDRGPSSKQVLDTLIQWESTRTLKPLRGNHEIMMLDARDRESEFGFWTTYGGIATLHSYGPVEREDQESLKVIPDEHWKFIEDRLLPYYEIETHFFVHANADPIMPLNEQRPLMLYWQRLFGDPPRHESGKIMVCGHTSQKSGLPLTNGNAICLDTWAYGEGWLSCLHVESGVIWQANQKGETRELHLDEL